MIIEACPYTGSHKSDPQIVDCLGRENIVALHSAKQDYVPLHTAPFSVKYVLSGTETYECENQTLSVKPYKYLITNKDQPYSSRIETKDVTFSLCVFFSDRFMSEGLRCMIRSGEYLLENPSDSTIEELNFDQKLYWIDNGMNGLLTKFLAAYQDDDIETDEWCAQLLSLLMAAHKSEQLKKSGLKAIKQSTKQELFKRLCYSIDFIHEYYHTKISLTQLANISCLSPFHFLRAFRQVFKVTPHQYITTVRLQYACRLLKQTKLAISDICLASGYRDESSFIRVFKAYFGSTPGEFAKVA